MTRSAVTLLTCLSILAIVTGCIGRTPEEEGGAVLYRRYCASCHGDTGRGDGPAAPVLCPPPPDLTQLTYGVPEILRQIDGRRVIRSHGTAAMPVWGEVFEQSLLREPHARRTALLRAQAIAEYVHGLQQRPKPTGSATGFRWRMRLYATGPAACPPRTGAAASDTGWDDPRLS